jgi:hypothetical protein
MNTGLIIFFSMVLKGALLTGWEIWKERHNAP